jgi:hypothetical protein
MNDLEFSIEYKKGVNDTLVPSRNNKFTKARRLLIEGRVRVTNADEVSIRATIRGDSGSYLVGYDPREHSQGWWCNCPAYGNCSHVQSLKLLWEKRVL